MKKNEIIRQRRKELGLSLQEVADKMGISKQTVSKYETGVVTNIPYESIVGLANALHASPAYLMGWTEDANDEYISVSGVKKTGEYYAANETLSQMFETISQLPDDAIVQLDNYIKFLVHEYKNKGVDEA